MARRNARVTTIPRSVCSEYSKSSCLAPRRDSESRRRSRGDRAHVLSDASSRFPTAEGEPEERPIPIPISAARNQTARSHRLRKLHGRLRFNAKNSLDKNIYISPRTRRASIFRNQSRKCAAIDRKQDGAAGYRFGQKVPLLFYGRIAAALCRGWFFWVRIRNHGPAPSDEDRGSLPSLSGCIGNIVRANASL